MESLPRSDDEQSRLVAEAAVVWSQAERVYLAPPKGDSDAWNAVERLAGKKACKQVESLLIDLLSHPNQLVVAYALFTLELMKSAACGSLPAQLLERKEKISVLMGCFLNKMELGAFARQVQKRNR